MRHDKDGAVRVSNDMFCRAAKHDVSKAGDTLGRDGTAFRRLANPRHLLPLTCARYALPLEASDGCAA